uniref:Uncharacterized protein n=1 Tax=Plectus sambesii TaxID=2011161 RepID=A0A914V5A7_9BILA
MFVDGEIRGPSRDLTQIHQQLQSKIQKVASGLQRLTSRKAIVSATGSNAITRQTSTISPQILNMWIRVHSSLIRELVRLQSTRYHQWHSHVQKWCLDEWHSVEQELTRERGLWGPDLGSSLDKWRLDTTETPSRIRRKLVPNQNFYALYPYRPYLDLPESKSMRAKVAISRDSRIFYEKMKERR